MRLLLIFSILLIGAFGLSSLLKRRFEETISLWIFSIIMILYMTGLFGSLKVGLYAVVVVFAFFLIISVFTFFKSRKDFLNNIFTPGLLVFFIFAFIVWWGQKDRMLTHWDTFSHWGLVVKNMAFLNTLHTNPASTTIFQSYPPGTALFEYFWVKFAGGFSDSNILRASNIIYISLMLPIFKNLKWKNYKQVIIRFIIVLILPLSLYGDLFESVLVDAMLGVMFAYILINYFTNELNTYNFITTGLALFILVLTKTSGAGLAAIAIIVISLDLIVVKRKEVKNFIVRDKRIETVLKIIILLSPIIFVIASKFSWSIHLSIMGIEGKSSDILNRIVVFFTEGIKEYQLDTIENFFKAITSDIFSDYIIKITLVGWSVILGAFSLVLMKSVRLEDEKRYKKSLMIILASIAIYAISLLFVYMFRFSEYEASGVASFSRYMKTIVLGILIFIIAMLFLLENNEDDILKNVKGIKKKRRINYSTWVLVLILLITNWSPIFRITFRAPMTAVHSIEARSIYEPIKRVTKVMNSDTDKLYFISIADGGYQYWVNRYNITPIIKTNENFTWSIGEPYYDGDIWTLQIDAKEWADILEKEYTHVYIFRTHEKFEKDFGYLFKGGKKSIKNDTLYAVTKTNSGIILEEVSLK